MNKTTKIITLTVLFFCLYFALDEYFFRSLRTWINGFIQQLGISHWVTYTIMGIPLFIGILIITKSKNIGQELGLQAPLLQGALTSFIFTLPMFMGYAIVFDFNQEITLNKVLMGVLAAGFFEELYFRGFLFGMLFKHTKLGFILSVIFGALLFASVHLYQSQDFGELVGIFAVTFMGAILFAWVYVEWNYNLWVPIFLHLFMNLSWLLFSAGDNALGGVYSNVFRVLTIAFTIIGTIVYKRRKGMDMVITRPVLWWK